MHEQLRLLVATGLGLLLAAPRRGGALYRGVVLMMLLPVGAAFLVVIASRRSIGPRLYEAAALEGCSPAAQLRRYVFDQSFEFGSLGYGAMLSLLLLLATLGLVVLRLLLVRRWRLKR